MLEFKSKTADKIIVDKTKPVNPLTKMLTEARKSANLKDDPIAYEQERLTTYATNHFNARLTIPLFLIFICFVISSWVGLSMALYWGLATALAYGFLISLCSKYLKAIKESDEDPDIIYWRRKFLTGQLIVAACWFVFGFYQCKNCGVENTYAIIQFSMILVFQAVTMILSYGFGSTILATSAPVTIILAFNFVTTYQPAVMLMGGILIGAQCFFYIIADRFRLSVLSDLEHQSERESLIAELETAKSMSEEARHRAEEANLAKSRFLATMSHELRTPLNAILGFSEVMKGEVLGPIENDTYKGYVDDINNSGNHLLNVINEILDLSRIEAGRQELQEEKVKLSHVAEETVTMVQLKAKQKSIKINTKFQDNLPPIWADQKAIRQITLNLLSNALKFTPTEGSICLTVGWTSKGGQYLSVKDNGPGIPEEEIPIVLSSFGQGSIAIKSAEEGTGLGLPIVQAMMQMHDGKFELKSKLRAGTEAIATFPSSRVLDFQERSVEIGNKKPVRKNITEMNTLLESSS